MERVAQVDLTAGERDRVERDLRWNLDKKVKERKELSFLRAS